VCKMLKLLVIFHNAMTANVDSFSGEGGGRLCDLIVCFYVKLFPSLN
jgi:hypothetical protein